MQQNENNLVWMIDYREIVHASKAWHFQSHLCFIRQQRSSVPLLALSLHCPIHYIWHKALHCSSFLPHSDTSPCPPRSCQVVTIWDMSIQLQLSTLQWLSSSLRQFSQLLILTPNDTPCNQYEVFAALEKSRRFAAPEDLQSPSRRMEKLEFPPSSQRNYAILNWAVTFIP